MTIAGIKPNIFGVLALTLLIAACSSKSDVGEPVFEPPVVEETDYDSDRDKVSETKVRPPQPGSQEELEAMAGTRVFFGYDQYDLSSQAQQILRKQADWLRQNPSKDVVIEGHCDERGTREYNLALGARRAASVRRYLMVLGVDGDRVRTISYGKERPEVAASNQNAWSRNRRAVTLVD